MIQVRIAGFGGQGIVLAGVVLGHAAILEGRQSAQSSSYGSESRGSACKSEVVISDGWIDFPHVVRPDVLVAMSQEAYKAYSAEMAEGGSVFYDPGLVTPSQDCKAALFAIAATETALKQLGKPIVANIIMLGAVVGRMKIVSADAVKDALRVNVSEKNLKLNLQAFETGLNL